MVPFDTRFGCVAEVLTTGAVPWKDLGNNFERFWCYSHLTAVELSLVIRQAGSARNDSETRFLKRVELTPKRGTITRWKDMWKGFEGEEEGEDNNGDDCDDAYDIDVI